MQLMEINSWSSFKSLIANKELSMQYTELEKRYDIYASEGHFMWHCMIEKVSPASSDQTDFENNYKSNANAKIYEPTIINGFRKYSSDADDLYRESIKNTVTANQTNNFDKKFTFDVYIYGGVYEVVGTPNDGDYLDIQVIDIDNVLGYGAGTVLATFVYKEYINTERKYNEITSEDGNKIPTGVYLRAKYVSVNTNAPTLIVRYKMRRA